MLRYIIFLFKNPGYINLFKYTSSERRRNILKLINFNENNIQIPQQQSTNLTSQDASLDEENNFSEGSSISIKSTLDSGKDSQFEAHQINTHRPQVEIKDMIISYSLRHNLTDSAITDLIKMLQALELPNTPKNISDLYKKIILLQILIFFVLVGILKKSLLFVQNAV